ncbi:hypothetical protein PLICRDRAFT_46334 [Plicaturopsis crispa FD-325 SS-3]|uniref:Repressor of RNA polymerase III transcription MAF1 n=1 Tax=Plicaturopsis crispa FD-325 SS-3 TaxID=944288 RepID=A0A0C9SR69_PLICR|nr:hypothetical protein PLICRDRAFT_46334 [Plicaturopsis crispa FD-325 SS-3]
MKYIENPELARLAQALTHEGPECSVHTRIEAYSCKNIKRDKKLFKSLEKAHNEEVSQSPPLPAWLALDREADNTPFGPIDDQASRKTLYLLIATLNIAFPDYEFSDVRPGHFNKEQSGASVLNALSTTLIAPHRAGESAPRTYSSYPPTSSDFFPSSVPTSSSPVHQYLPSPYAPPPIVSGTHPTLYRLLDQVIGLGECEVFSYVPDIESDPHANDFDSEEEGGETADDDEDSSSDDDEATFEFDDYDVDEESAPPGRHARLSTGGRIAERPRRGALLWSSHWFFLNRKLKRILFISVWARTRAVRSWAEDAVDEGYGSMSEKAGGERFWGWEGGIGAGARAMGLSVSV